MLFFLMTRCVAAGVGLADIERHLECALDAARAQGLQRHSRLLRAVSAICSRGSPCPCPQREARHDRADGMHARAACPSPSARPRAAQRAPAAMRRADDALPLESPRPLTALPPSSAIPCYPSPSCALPPSPAIPCHPSPSCALPPSPAIPPHPAPSKRTLKVKRRPGLAKEHRVRAAEEQLGIAHARPAGKAGASGWAKLGVVVVAVGAAALLSARSLAQR